MSKKVFITFGAGGRNFYEAVNRICEQAKKTDLFDEIKGFTDNDLRNDISFWDKHGNFISKNPRGFGYWVWKSYLILQTLDKMSVGDILLYCDCGNEINYHAKEEFNKLLESSSEKQLIATDSGHSTRNWTKRDLLVLLDMDNDSVLSQNQHQSNTMIFVKNDNIMNVVREWYSLSENYHNIDDSPSRIQNYLEFVEHRHDQSIFNLLIIKYNLRNIDFDPTYFQNWNDYNLIKNRPLVTARNKTGRSFYQELS
jgi:hypothetical protein